MTDAILIETMSGREPIKFDNGGSFMPGPLFWLYRDYREEGSKDWAGWWRGKASKFIMEGHKPLVLGTVQELLGAEGYERLRWISPGIADRLVEMLADLWDGLGITLNDDESDGGTHVILISVDGEKAFGLST